MVRIMVNNSWSDEYVPSYERLRVVQSSTGSHQSRLIAGLSAEEYRAATLNWRRIRELFVVMSLPYYSTGTHGERSATTVDNARTSSSTANLPGNAAEYVVDGGHVVVEFGR